MCQQKPDRKGPVFGIKTSLDLYEKLKVDSERLRSNLNEYDLFNFLITAWHLYADWRNAEDSHSLSKQKRNHKNLPKEMRILLDTVRDIVNGSKHFCLDAKSSEKRVVQEILTGKEVGFYAWLFSERIPAVNAKKEDKLYYFSVRSIHNIVMRYFVWVFDDDIPTKEFPSEIVEAIRYCVIADRGNVPRPSLLCDSY